MMKQHNEVLDVLCRSLVTRIDALTEALVAAIDEQEGSYRVARSVPAEDLHRSCRDNLLAALQILGDAVPPGLDPLDAPRATGRRRAEQRMPLDVVLHSFRIGGRVIWEELVRAARGVGPGTTAALLDAATSVWEVVDQVSSAVADSYHAAAREMLRSDDDRIRVLLEGLLSGQGHEPGLAAEAARALGLPSNGGFAVVVAAEPDSEGARLPGIQALLATAGMASAWHQWPEQLIGVVALGGRDLGELTGALAAFAQERIGLSARIDALADVPQAYRQAGTALATLPPDGAGTAQLEEVLPAALVVAQPDLGRRLLQVVLGDVLALAAPERDLMLETMRAWLAADGSASATAAALYCHRNTVLNRLRRIGVLIGRPVENTRTRVELSLALTALDVLPRAHPEPGPANRARFAPAHRTHGT